MVNRNPFFSIFGHFFNDFSKFRSAFARVLLWKIIKNGQKWRATWLKMGTNQWHIPITEIYGSRLTDPSLMAYIFIKNTRALKPKNTYYLPTIRNYISIFIKCNHAMNIIYVHAVWLLGVCSLFRNKRFTLNLMP